MSRVVVEMTADEAQLFRAMGKILGQQKAMEAGYGKVARKSKEAGQKQDEAFGAKAIGNLKAYAMGFLGLSAAIAGVTAALRKMDEAREAAGQRLDAASDARGELFQFAQGNTPAEIAASGEALLANAQEIFRRGGARDEATATNMEAALQGADAGDFRETAIRIGRTGLFGQVDELIRATEAIQSAFGEAEAGSYDAILSKGLGAGIAPGNVNELLLGTSRAAATGSILGLSDEEVMAATTLAAIPLGSTEQGGTFANSLFTSLAEQGDFKGLSLKEMLAKIEQDDLEFPELKQAFGRTEAIKALDSLIKQQDKLDQVLGTIRQAEAQNKLGMTLDAAEQSSLLAPEIARRERKNAREDAEIDLGRGRAFQEAVQERQIQQVMTESGGGWWGQLKATVMRAGGNVGQFLLGDEAMLRAQRKTGALDDLEDPALKASVEQFLRERDAPRPSLTDGAGLEALGDPLAHHAPPAFPGADALPARDPRQAEEARKQTDLLAANLDALRRIGSLLETRPTPRTPSPVSARASQLSERHAEVA